ncbi:MAG: PilM [Aliidongia sp.]|jgi:hypothetical protein|nr:PilM [Aliidongia sp.]
MTAFPNYIFTSMLLLLLPLIVLSRLLQPVQYGQMANAAAMITFHEAAEKYADANPSFSGAISAANILSGLPQGYQSSGLFNAIVVAPGTVATFLAIPSGAQANIISLVQHLTANNVLVGPVVAGAIVPLLPLQPAIVAAGVPNGTIAMQTILRNH